ncbi:MAG: cobalt-precorrin 5A hydrolase [Candidatus Bathyarchaeota archaeon]|nr:cobalt-precorrin 5A hydrolase [Candidatus Bathyarchaeum sp.]
MATVKAKTMFPRGVTIFAITRQGVKTAAKIKDVLTKNNINCTIRAPRKYAQKGVIPLEKKLGDAVREAFSYVDAIVAVMATGIIVRTIAPLLKSKMSDPAVVCVDVSGRFAISLVSGHLGGANKLTKIIAQGLEAVPVITTASDVLGKQSVDELATELHCTVINPQSLVAVNSAIVNEQELVLVLSGTAKISLNKISSYKVKTAENIKHAIEIVNSFDAGVIITNEENLVDELSKPATILKPKTITVGMGSRKKVSVEDIVETVSSALSKANITVERVDRLATVDIKKDSLSMLNAAKKLGLNLEFISIKELGSFRHKDLSADSQVVKEKIGVGGVCEQAALIVAGKNPKLIMKKMKSKGVTVAIASGE